MEDIPPLKCLSDDMSAIMEKSEENLVRNNLQLHVDSSRVRYDYSNLAHREMREGWKKREIVLSEIVD